MKLVYALEVDGKAVQTALNPQRLGPRKATSLHIVTYISVEELQQCLSLTNQDEAMTAVTSLVNNALELSREQMHNTKRKPL